MSSRVVACCAFLHSPVTPKHASGGHVLQQLLQLKHSISAQSCPERGDVERTKGGVLAASRSGRTNEDARLEDKYPQVQELTIYNRASLNVRYTSTVCSVSRNSKALQVRSMCLFPFLLLYKSVHILLLENTDTWSCTLSFSLYNPFKCHEEVLCLQPMIPPRLNDLTSPPPDWGMLRRSKRVQIFR